jgi:hypothetical protein
MQLIIEDWANLSDRELDMDGVKSIHHPTDHFLFRTDSYAPDSIYAGLSPPYATKRKRWIYVTQGSCSFWIPNDAAGTLVEVSVGQRMAGYTVAHAFEVTSSERFEYIIASELPDEHKGLGIK